MSKTQLFPVSIVNIIVVHLSMNYLKNTFHDLLGQITGNLTILKASETKLNESCPAGQFIIDGFEARYSVE